MGKRGKTKNPKSKRDSQGKLRLSPEARKEAWDAEQRDTMSVAIGARKRVHGLNDEKAKDPIAGTLIGRMFQSGELSRAQYEAGAAFAMSMTDYSKVVHGPKPATAVDLNRVAGASGRPDDEEHTRRVISRHKAAREAVQEAQMHLGNRGVLFSALTQYLVREYRVDHQLGDLRIALNALSRHYKVYDEKAA